LGTGGNIAFKAAPPVVKPVEMAASSQTGMGGGGSDAASGRGASPRGRAPFEAPMGAGLGGIGQGRWS
jgi:hypothetical protein